MNEWKEGVWIAVSALLVAVFFTFVTTVVTAVREASKIQQVDINNIEVLKEYYKVGCLDDVIVRQTYVVNCIYEFRGKYEIYATSTIQADDYSEATYDCQWKKGTNAWWYQFENINSKLPKEAKFRVFLAKDANGSIISLMFKRIS